MRRNCNLFHNCARQKNMFCIWKEDYILFPIQNKWSYSGRSAKPFWLAIVQQMLQFSLFRRDPCKMSKHGRACCPSSLSTAHRVAYLTYLPISDLLCASPSLPNSCRDCHEQIPLICPSVISGSHFYHHLKVTIRLLLNGIM